MMMKNQNRSRALEVKSADTCGEFLGVSSCVITVILVTFYITEINLSLSLKVRVVDTRQWDRPAM